MKAENQNLQRKGLNHHAKKLGENCCCFYNPTEVGREESEGKGTTVSVKWLIRTLLRFSELKASETPLAKTAERRVESNNVCFSI